MDGCQYRHVQYKLHVLLREEQDRTHHTCIVMYMRYACTFVNNYILTLITTGFTVELGIFTVGFIAEFTVVEFTEKAMITVARVVACTCAVSHARNQCVQTEAKISVLITLRFSHLSGRLRSSSPHTQRKSSSPHTQLRSSSPQSHSTQVVVTGKCCYLPLLTLYCYMHQMCFMYCCHLLLLMSYPTKSFIYNVSRSCQKNNLLKKFAWMRKKYHRRMDYNICCSL